MTWTNPTKSLKKKNKKRENINKSTPEFEKKKPHRHCGVRYSRLSVLRIEFQIFFYLFLDCKFSDFNDVLGLAQKTLSRLVFGNHFGPNIVGQNNQKKKKEFILCCTIGIRIAIVHNPTCFHLRYNKSTRYTKIYIFFATAYHVTNYEWWICKLTWTHHFFFTTRNLLRDKL